MDIRFNRVFSLLQQEGHLARNTLLHGFDLLLKSNMTDNKKGNFYSAFFQISIGLERTLKIIVIMNHMLTNNLTAPTDEDLKRYSHKISSLYSHALSIYQKFNTSNKFVLDADSPEHKILNFFHSYAMNSRYYNLKALSNSTVERDPIGQWWDICLELFQEETPYHIQKKIETNIFHNLDQIGYVGYVPELDFDNQAMTTFDQQYRIAVFEKSAPYAIWSIIKLLNPIYTTVYELSLEYMKTNMPNEIRKPSIPMMYEFFTFVLSDRRSTLTKRRWAP